MGDTDTEHLAMDGRFILLDLLGQGGVGEVWRATEVASGRPIALKLLRDEFSNDPQLRRRFTREARAASAMKHENIGAVYDYGADLNGRLFISMEFLDGPSLAEAIDAGISARNILEFASQLLAGLAHAHARGVIHRDLKPDNIVLDGAKLPTEIGVSKLVDFGIATATFDQTNTRETMQGEVVGTPRYMSPEQAMGERELSPRSDIYNAGLILYELVSGAPPFQGAKGLDVMSRHVHDAIPTLSPRQGLEMAPGLLEVIERALEKSPNERFDSAGEMRREIGAIMAAIRVEKVYDRLPQQADELFGEITRANSVQKEDRDTVQHQPTKTPNGLLYMRGPGFLVGREDEKQRLLDLVDQSVEQGHGSIVICEGETGVGKSLLTAWLREQVIEHGWMRAESGRFVEHGQGSLWGLIEVLEHIFHTGGLSRSKARARIEDGLDTEVMASAVELDIVMDFLRPQTAGGRPGDHHDRLVPALGSVIERYIGQRPTLLVLEDIHLAGRDLLRLLGYLAHRMRSKRIPILILATTRKESIHEAPDLKKALDELTSEVNPHCHMMSLDRFDGARGRQLIKAILDCDQELVQLILDRAMGNPLHIVLLLHYLYENDHLTQRGTSWGMRDPAMARSVVPPGLSDLFEHRLLEVEEQHGSTGRLERVLQLAGLVGMQFHYHVLQQVAVQLDGQETAHRLESDLNTLVGEGFLREVHKGYDWYRFEHALVRDWLIHRVDERRRATHHRAIALAIESVFGETTHEFSFQLADHWRAAGDVAKASHWYQVAGLDALRTSPRRAQRAYQACLEMMNALLSTDGSEVLDEEVYKSAGLSTTDYLGVLSRLGDLAEGFGRFEEAEKAYRRVVRTVAKMITPPTDDGILGALGYSWLGLGEVAWQRGDFEAADWAFRKVREIAQRSEELASLDIDAVLGLARIAWHRGNYTQAEKLARVANRNASSLQRTHEEAESLWMLGETARILGHLVEAQNHYERSIAIFRREKMLHGIATNLLSMAQLARYQKLFDEARDLYIRALAHYDDLGDRRGAGRCHNGLGDVARLAEEHELADHHYGCALEIMETIGAEYDVAIVMANLGINAFDRGLLEQAESYLSASQMILRAEDFPYLLAGIDYNLALVKASKGETEAARSLVARGTDRNRNNPIADIDYAQPLERMAQLQADEGDWEAAVELWTRAGKIYEELGLDDDRKRIQTTLQEAEGEEPTS
jgi:eukaryotic-like serine/threonine-protein kinase